MSYLSDENHLLVHSVYKDLMENDMFLTYIAIRANYGMTGKELLDACLDAWQLDKGQHYRMTLIRADKETEIQLEQNIKQFGIRNGDPLRIEEAGKTA